MTGSPESLLVLARDCVRRAVNDSKPGNLEGVEYCKQLLDEAADHVRTMQASMADIPASRREGTRQSLAIFQHEIRCAQRVIDFGATFYRLLGVRCGVSSVNYDSAGCVVAESTSTASELHA